MKKVLFWMLALAILVGITSEYVVSQSARTLSPIAPGADKSKVKVYNYRLSWKGNTLTNRDTSITMLTGAPRVYDTTDALYNIAGANTLAIQNIWTAWNDSSLGILRMDVSNDGTNWGFFPSLEDTLGPGVDSSSFLQMTNPAKSKLRAIASVPGCQFVRFRLEKRLSGATDTLKVQSYLFVTFNDE